MEPSIIVTAGLGLVIAGFVAWITRGFWQRKGPHELHGIAIEARTIEVTRNGKIPDARAVAKKLFFRRVDDDADISQRVTEYTVDLPEFMTPLWVADVDSLLFYRLESAGKPRTGDATFDNSFCLLRDATPKTVELLEIPEVRDLLVEISQKLGAVRVEGDKLIFRDVGGTTQTDVEITAELVSGLLSLIDVPSERSTP